MEGQFLLLLVSVAANSVQAAPAGLNGLILTGLAESPASSVALTMAKQTAEAIGRARFRILALRWGGVTTSVGLMPLLLSRMLTGHQSSKASGALPSGFSPDLPWMQATLDSDPLAIDKDGQHLLLHIADARTDRPIGNVRLTLVSTGTSPIPTTA